MRTASNALGVTDGRSCRFLSAVPTDLSPPCDRWPLQAVATVAALEAGDKATLSRLGGNWCEQLQLEEGFIHSVYHHLLYTMQAVWDATQTLIEDAAEEIAHTKAVWKVGGGVAGGRCAVCVWWTVCLFANALCVCACTQVVLLDA